MASHRNRVAVLHGVNLDMLGRRPAEHYGKVTFTELEHRIETFAHGFGLQPLFFQSNHEGEYVEELHRLADTADALVLNPGAWTHYSWAIRDALEVCGLPAVEVHLSAVDQREEWRRQSVIRDLCLETVSGQGVEGYRVALQRLKRELSEGSPP